MNCPFCGSSPRIDWGYQCGTSPNAVPLRSTRCWEAEVAMLKERIKRLESFISEVAKPWECTCRFTVWNSYHKKRAECDCCRAEGLLKEAKP